MNEKTYEVIIRALAERIEHLEMELANRDRQLEVERKAAKHLIDGIEG